jgi:hypothetical protein
LAFSITSTRGALAQSAADSTAAQALFDQAKQLMADGNSKEACPKFEESQRLDPGSGTLVNLAHCYEELGRLASAWSKYLEAASAAKAAGNTERETVAREQAAALAPRLSKLVISVEAGAKEISGLEVRRDGDRVGAPQWGLPIPIDAGEHTVEATAPGHTAWRSNVTVERNAATATVTVPALSAGASPVPESTGGPSDKALESGGLGTQRTLAIVAAGVGVVGIGVGTVFALQSKSKHDEAEGDCSGSVCRTTQGLEASEDARSAGNIATIGMVVGLAGLAGGAALWFTAPKSTQPVQVGVGFGTVRVGGTF